MDIRINKDGFTINSEKNLKYQLYNINGMKIRSGNTINNSQISGLLPGVYIIKMQIDNEFKTQKILIY